MTTTKPANVPIVAASGPGDHVQGSGSHVHDITAELAAIIKAHEDQYHAATPPPVEPPPVEPPPTEPPPSGTRPFPPPVTSRTVVVPSPTGGDDFAHLNNFIAGVPNGSVIVFPASLYRLSQGVMLGNRQHLVFDLGSAEFRLTGDGGSHFSSAFIPGYSYQTRSFTGGASNLRFTGGTVTGNDPQPGAPQPLRGENQQAVRSNGTTFLEVTGMTVQAVSGDGAFFDGGSDIWVHHNHVITAGRNCATVIKGLRVLIEDNRHDRCGYVTFDLEPNVASEASADIIYRRNTAGSWGLDWVSVDGGARGADIRRLTIADNTTTSPLDLHVDNKDGVNGNTAARMKDVIVTGNKGGGTTTGPRLFFRNIDGLTIKGNVQALSSGQLSSIINCTGVVQVVEPPPSGPTPTLDINFANGMDARLKPTYQVGDPGYGLDSDFLGNLSQVTVANGVCTITAERKTTPSGRAYASASMGTNGTFSQRYGTFESRIRYPKGQGVFPAFWLLRPGTPVTPPETDIFEAFPAPPGAGGGSGLNYLSSGMNTSLGPYPAGGPLAPPLYYDSRGDLTLDWHVHKMVWTPTTVQLWIDGIDRGTYTDAAKIATLPAMYPIITFAMGASGYRVDATTPAKLTMDIDYIRVWA